MPQFRQGDLLICLVEALPDQSVATPARVLGEGEKPGHRHVLEGPATVHVHGIDLYFHATGECRVTHPEHGLLELPPGSYEVIRQRVYRPERPPERVYD